MAADKSNSILLAWLGNADLDRAFANKPNDLGPIADAVLVREPSRVVILSAQDRSKTIAYENWLREKTRATEVRLRQTRIADPWDFAAIYRESIDAVASEIPAAGRKPSLIFHLSPGTGAMSAAWIILSKTRFAAELIQSSQFDAAAQRYPIRTANLPFDLSIELVGDLLRKPGDELSRLAASLPPAKAEFAKIIHKCEAMDRVILQARRVALVDRAPVLILGETGTGKELFAKAIHVGSPRAKRTLIALNCGAIEKELVNSRLFGHRKGSFTSAIADYPGVFEQANEGTVFLDEIGELPLHAQVRLLRVLQEGEVTRVGDQHPTRVDVRIVAATNRDLIKDVADGRFRADLFYRIAVAILKLPPLRDRGGDIDLLIDEFLRNSPPVVGSGPRGPRRIALSARRRLREHTWPGNLRELRNTLTRASIWAMDDELSKTDIESALLELPQPAPDIMSRELGNGFDLRDLLEYVKGHYVQRAIEQSNGNQTVAADLLGLTRQTFGNWSRDILNSSNRKDHHE